MSGGARPRAEYESRSIAEQARQEGVSRMTIYRRRKAEQARNQPNVTGAGTAILLTSEEGPVTGTSERGFASKEARGLTPAGGWTHAVPEPFPGYSDLPLRVEADGARLVGRCAPLSDSCIGLKYGRIFFAPGNATASRKL